MRKCFTTILLIILTSPCFAQIAFQDAIRLKAYVQSDGTLLIPATTCGDTRVIDKTCAEFLQMVNLIRPYLRDNLKTKDALVIVTELRDPESPDYNPFIGPMLRSPTANSVDLARHSERVRSTLEGAVSSIGGLDVTTIADGIARFMVERTKQELNIHFFDQFNKFLNDSNYGKDVQALFPNTHAVLSLAKDNLYNYQQWLQSFREAFTQDLASLLVNVNDWVNQDPTRAVGIVKAIQGLKIYPYLQFALQVAADLQQGKHPGDILNDLVTETFIDTIDQDIEGFASAIRAANVLSQSLRSDDGASYWIDGKSFNAFKEETFTRLYLGLVYQRFLQNPEIKFGNDPFYKTLALLANDLNKVYPFLNNINRLIKDTEQIISQLQSNTGPGISQNYVSLLKNTSEFANLAHSLFPDKVPSTEFLDDAAFIATHVNNLTADVRTKSYNAAVIEVSLILQKLGVNHKPFTEGFLKYGMFMANVASAKTSEEVKQAIEVIALPPGSYQVKRESRANISINGYLGLYAGREYLPAAADVNAFSAGVFAPVGVAFSLGGCKCFIGDGGKSHSLFFSLIDVGALASFRFDDESTSVAPTIKLKDIVAPGLYYVFGFGRSPISLGVGAQLGPNLRKIDPSANPEIDQDFYVRYGMFLAVDIPFLTLYNRKDKKVR